MRLVSESCAVEWFPPWFDLVRLKMPEGIEALLTIMPSTTKSGSGLALIDETPRRRTCVPPPGAPSLRWMLAPATLPCRACSTVCAGTSLSSSPWTVAIETARCLRSVLDARPVTTISSAISRCRPIFSSDWLSGRSAVATR